MSGDWQKGDLALCVNRDRIRCVVCGNIHNGVGVPEVGAVLTVSAFTLGGYTGFPCPAPRLVFVGGGFGLPQRFRKIRPHMPDAEDRETIRLLNGVPVGEPA